MGMRLRAASSSSSGRLVAPMSSTRRSARDGSMPSICCGRGVEWGGCVGAAPRQAVPPHEACSAAASCIALPPRLGARSMKANAQPPPPTHPSRRSKPTHLHQDLGLQAPHALVLACGSRGAGAWGRTSRRQEGRCLPPCTPNTLSSLHIPRSLQAGSAPSLLRADSSESTSSMKMTEGATCAATANSARTCGRGGVVGGWVG